MTLLKKGDFNRTGQRNFLQALDEMKQEAMAASADAHHAGDDGGPSKRARVDHDALRQAALDARLEYWKGERLSQKLQKDKSIYASLSHSNKLLLSQFNNGKLLERRKQADNAYGHGRDVHCLNIRERAILRAWSSDTFHAFLSE